MIMAKIGNNSPSAAALSAWNLHKNLKTPESSISSYVPKNTENVAGH